MTLDELLSLLEKVRKTSGGYEARCPSHDDRTASLSISEGEGGKILLKCHAGCPTEQICESLSIAFKDLFPQKITTKRRKTKKRAKIIARYTYHDEQGAALFQVVKAENKSFYQRSPDGKGGWKLGLCGAKLVPYQLPDLVATPVEETVFVVEGEKDADNLRTQSLHATCNPGGAGKWRHQFSRWFKGRKVAILPDNDDPGRAHAEQVAKYLFDVVASVKMVELPGLEPKGDVSDWLASGGMAGQLEQIVAETPDWKPTKPQTTTFLHTTDLGNSERFIEQHGKDVKWWPQRGQWLIWDGKRWQVDEAGRIIELAKKTIKSIYKEAETAEKHNGVVLIGGEPTKNEKTAARVLRSHAKASQAAARIKAMLLLSTTVDVVFEKQLDANPWILTVDNGTLDLRTGKLRPHCRDDYCTRLVTTPFNEDACAPRWESFLNQTMKGDKELKEFLQRSVGYALTGSTSEQCLWFLYGTGANGKSTFLTVVRALLEDGLSKQLNFGDLEAKNTNDHPTRFARLVGARLVTATESDQGCKLAEPIIKDMTGGEPLAARFMRRDFFEFIPAFKLWIAGNYKPVIRGADEGIWRRIKLVPFTFHVAEDDRIEDLPEKIVAEELPGILAWAVRGCLDWQREGLGKPAAVTEATDEYRTEMDVLGEFITDCCIVNDEIKSSSNEIYRTYQDWCEAGGRRAWTQTTFSLRLRERGFQYYRSRFERGWNGIGVTSNDGDPSSRHLTVVRDDEKPETETLF